MPTHIETLNITTKSNLDIVNITGEVSKAVTKSKLKNGSLIVFTPHTTAAVTVNEGEPGLKKDILKKIAELVPAGEGYYHDSIDSNAHSHILASIIGCSVSIPVIEGVRSEYSIYQDGNLKIRNLE